MVDLGRLGGDLYDGVGNLVDKGKEIAGEAIDTGTDVLGSGLEKVGAEQWADAVEDWGTRQHPRWVRRSASSSSGGVRKPTS
ncbi:putative T7SS-secreted protein [Streptomyces sp. M10(2022)]